MSFRASFVKQTTEYTITVPDASTNGAVAVAEDLTYSEIEIQGWTTPGGSGGGGAGSTPGDEFAYLTVSGSTITATRNGNEGGLTIKIVVTEYRKFAMLQPVQRGVITLGQGGPSSVDSSAFTAIGSKARVKSLGWATGASNNVSGNATSGLTVVKTDSTHATATRLNNGFGMTVGFEVVDWK